MYYNAFVGTASGVFKGMPYPVIVQIFSGSSFSGYPKTHLGLNVIEKCEVFVKNLDSLKSATNKNPITAMSWGEGIDEEILIGYGSQLIKIYNVNSRSFTLSEERKCGEGAIIGICKQHGSLITASESGIVKVWKDDGDPVVIETGGPLERMRKSTKNVNIIATGGKENDLKLWDIETGSQTFAAKNVRNDDLELRVPIWVTDMTFISNTDKVAVTTRHGHVRLYDPSSHSKRPVVSVQVPEQALTCVASSSKDHHVIVGSGTGQMNLVDLRSRGLVMNKYKDFVGGIKAIACTEDDPYIASVSLDRNFRIHHIYTKELVYKEYLQSKLTCVLLRRKFDLTEPEDVDGAEEEVIEENDKDEEKEDSSSDEEVKTLTKTILGAEKRASRTKSPAGLKKQKT